MIFDYTVVNGQLMPLAQAQISLFNKAYFSSFGVYEAVKVEQGRPFYLEEHLRRLQKSAAMLDLELGADVPTLAEWAGLLCQRDPQATWNLRILVLGAVEAGASPLIGMQPEPLATYPALFYESGARAVLYEGQRALPRCKSLNTLVNTLARRTATQAGALEGLLHHHGHLTEGSRSNLFAIHKGQLLTPPETEVLSGITRDIIIHMMRDTAYPIVEAPLPVDLSLYEEIFISSTSMHVMPLTRIGEAVVGDGQVGPVTRLAMERFAAHYRRVMRESRG
jgi:branched-subunit amino acid aminotransferase/4-amino-4-deoxychorismate lyase